MTDGMSREEIGAALSRHAASTAGEWIALLGRQPYVVVGSGHGPDLSMTDANVVFIASAHRDVPRLCAEVLRLRRLCAREHLGIAHNEALSASPMFGPRPSCGKAICSRCSEAYRILEEPM